jgi:putative Ca2+/H+ antiporter (TMEM165/GDT1 family)
MLTAALVSLSVVFVAELGDKSQLMTMTYALRHRWWVVLSGVGIASFMVHGLSVTIGHFLGLTLPERPIAFARPGTTRLSRPPNRATSCWP